MLDFNQDTRISAQESLLHPYFTEDDPTAMCDNSYNTSLSSSSTSDNMADDDSPSDHPPVRSSYSD